MFASASKWLGSLHQFHRLNLHEVITMTVLFLHCLLWYVKASFWLIPTHLEGEDWQKSGIPAAHKPITKPPPPPLHSKAIPRNQDLDPDRSDFTQIELKLWNKKFGISFLMVFGMFCCLLLTTGALPCSWLPFNFVQVILYSWLHAPLWREEDHGILRWPAKKIV